MVYYNEKVYSFTAEKLYSDHWHKVMDITYRQRAGRVEETQWRNIVHRRWQPQLADNVCSVQASCTATTATTNMSTIDLEHATWYALQKVQQNLTKRLLSRENKQQTRKSQPFHTHCCHIGTATKHPVPDRVNPAIICNVWHTGTLILRAERQECPDDKNY